LSLAVGRAIAFLPFFVAGFWARAENWPITSRPTGRADFGVAALALALTAGLCWWTIRSGTTALLFMAFPYGEAGAGLSQGLAFRLVYYVNAFLVIRLLMAFAPRRPTVLTPTGVNSLAVYLLHVYVLQVVCVGLGGARYESSLGWLVPALTA